MRTIALRELSNVWQLYLIRANKDAAFDAALAKSMEVEQPAAWPTQFPDLVALFLAGLEAVDPDLTPKAYGLATLAVMLSILEAADAAEKANNR